MRTLLVFPPAADPAHPPLGIAALAGYLSARGEDVALLDLNLRAYHELLTADFLSQCAAKMRRRMGAFRRHRTLRGTELSEYVAVANHLPSAEWLIERVEDARRRLRDPATYASRAAYAETTSIVRRAMQFVSAAHHPASWSAGGFAMSAAATRSAEVLSATGNRRENLFLPLFESVMPEIAAQRPDIVGISLNYRVQMIPAMTLASLLRKTLPGAFIVVGGGLVPFFAEQPEVLAPFRHLVDAWVAFEGERTLFELTRKLARGERIEGGRILQSPPPPLSELPPPRFDGLPLREYLSPEPVLPMLASRGCYWGRCAFCAHGHVYREQYRSEPTARVVETMDALSRRYGAGVFYFVDEAVPPRVAGQLADHIARSSLPYRWFGEARFEKIFDAARLQRLAAGGCRMLLFGLESGVQRVLDLMDKGITPESAAKILRDCTAAGIRTFVMFFSGFPTETREEAERTLHFIEEHSADITYACGGQFVLEPQSPVFAGRERFGITRVYPYPDEDLKTWSQYEVREGLSAEEAGALAREIEQLPLMKPPDFHLVSRSHLIFLPPAEYAYVEAEAPALADIRDDLVPRRRDGLVPQRLPFSLEEADALLHAGAAAPLAPNPTDYVFSPDREAMLEIGPDGLSLLRACGGEFSLGDILGAVGEANRDGTLRFFRDLEARQFLSWETRA